MGKRLTWFILAGLVLGVVVGWATNALGMWLIFEPPEPRRILGIKVHGLFLRRQDQAAEVYAQIIAEDVITLDLPAREADRTVVQLVDGGGQVRKQWLAEFSREETRRMTLDLSGVPSGLYTLTWTGTNGTIGNGRIEKR